MKNKITLFIFTVFTAQAPLNQVGLNLPPSFSPSPTIIATQPSWYQAAWETLAGKFSDMTNFSTDYTGEFSLPSIPTWQDVTANTPAYNPESPLHNVAIGTAALVGLYGIYRYHGAYISRDLKLIEDELKFIEELIENPYQFHVSKLENISDIEPKLAKHKADIIRALGLTPSFINPKSFLARLYQEELDQITTLFNNLNAISKSVTIQELRAGGEDQAIVINNLLTVYFYLLQALNAYKPETLNLLMEKINRDQTYQLSETLRNEFPAYMKVRELGKLAGFRCEPCTTNDIQRVTQNSKTLLSDIEYQLYGYRIFRYFLSNQKKTELNELNNLFGRVETTLVQQPRERQAFAAAVNDFLNTLVKRLPTKTKWAIVKDYLTTKAATSFYLYTERPEPAPQQPTQPQRPPQQPGTTVYQYYGAQPQQQPARPTQQGQQQNQQQALAGYNNPHVNPWQ